MDVGSLLLAAGAAHLLVLSLGHSDHGGYLLAATGAALLAASTLHRWRSHRRPHRRRPPGAAPPQPAAGAAAAPTEVRAAAEARRERLWRMRVAVDDVPGGLAALTAQMAGCGADIRLMQVHPGGGEAIDELYVTAPAELGADRLREAAARAGGRHPVVEPADVHDLSDTTARALSLVAALARGEASLAEALTAVSGARGAQHRAAPPPGMEREDLRGAVMSLPAPEGGVLLVHRRGVPFTPVEFARCRALVHTAACLGARLRGDVLPEG
ncbi:ACT domain-containing protein [Streptomonospora litoralis]|uniref:hypothetical protein n=1 Tax=Streptomonospora litoralis TaxID=2498135 RepID=UPI003100E6BE